MNRLIFIVLFCFSLFAAEPIAPIPVSLDSIDLPKAKLGRMLFLDPSLSSDKTVSCHDCHNFEFGGADPRDVSIGVQGRKGGIQSPTVYNARFNFKQFWNGRATNLEEQASGPLTAHVEMNMTPEKVETELNANTLYQEEFKKIYGVEYITMDNVINAIVEFEKALITPNSRFDRYLRGEIRLNEEEAEGYEKFKRLGCITCHNGINIGSNAFQKMGLFKDYPYDEKYQDRFAITKQESHKNVFKVPTLRNITLTAPYFHDTNATTLEDAITKMAFYNLGITLTIKDRDLIIAFLKSLEGERPVILDMP
ncbi:MAG: c-type cytochrome [Helicobacteraceae bacterium]|jgi:cytochrome c peroxidase|nr:c-type cytochrome [Helicobacteraceae bacterium]